MPELGDLVGAAVLAATGSIESAHTAIAAIDWLTESITADRDAGRFAQWGLSSAIDENTGTATIPPALFAALHDRAGIEAEWPIGNAGLVHCYGYLLSLEPTPYGLKRERWLGADLAAACGLADDAFVPWREGPTLLARAGAAASALLHVPTSRAQLIDGRQARVALSAVSGPAALAYAVSPDAASAPLLVTMFPVSDAAAVITEFGASARLRWNAV